MRIVQRDIRVLFITAVIWGFGASGASFLLAQEPDLSRPVKEALDRFAELKSFAVTWTHQYKSGEPGRDKKWSDLDVQYLVWQGGKMYTRFQEGRAWTDAPKAENAFNGQLFTLGNRDQKTSDGKPKNSGIIINLAANEQPDADYFGTKSFHPMGIHLPRGVSELLHSKQLQSQLSFMLEHGGQLRSQKQAQIDGRTMTRIALLVENPLWALLQREDMARTEKMWRRTPGAKEEQIQQKIAELKRVKELTPRKVEHVFYLDPETGYAVRRWQEWTEDGKLQGQADCTDHVKLPGHEIWLPRKCRIDTYVSFNSPGECFKTPCRTDVVEVSAFDTKPVPDELFTLKYTAPGTEVTDRTLPEAKLAPGADVGLGGVAYQIPALPEDLDTVIEDARALIRKRAEAEWRQKWIRWIMLSSYAAPVVAGIVYLVVRYRRRKAASS